MADATPTRLDEYCKTYGITFFDLQIPCLFCRFKLQLQDLADFYCKDLSLVWRDSVCFACCCKCLRLCAKFEKENYSRCVVKGCNLEGLVQKPLTEILVRCLFCFRKLDYSEKIDCCIKELPFCLIRHHWRNICRFCRREQ